MAREASKSNMSPEEVQQAIDELKKVGVSQKPIEYGPTPWPKDCVVESGFVEDGDYVTEPSIAVWQDGKMHHLLRDGLSKNDLLGRERVVGLKSRDSNLGVNPKDKIGSAKVSYSLCPSSARIAWALAQMDGATKYGPYNWRVEPVQLRTYIDAATRHLDDFLEGEAFATDSGVHHLGHVMACCAIMIDAMQHGTFTDDRPINGEGSKGLDSAAEFIKTKPEGWGK